MKFNFAAFLIVFLVMSASVMASSLTSTSTYTNPDGLIAYWDFAQCTGTSATDRGDWGNTGTLTNSPTWVVGKYGCGVNFVPTVGTPTPYIISASNISITGDSPRTFSVWAKPINMSNPSVQAVVAWGSASANSMFSLSVVGGSWYFNGWVCDFAFGTSYLSTWQHLTIVYNMTDIIAYENGIYQNKRVCTLTTTNSQVYIGVRFDQLSYQGFNGSIDEVKIWNRALSAEEIYEDYLGTYANIEAYYQSLTTGNVTNSTSVILGNMSSNFTNTNNLITYLNGNLSSNFTHTNGLISEVLGNQTLILGNQTLILGNESTIITNIAYLNGNLSANFTYTNGQIALVLGNQTLILGNETLILTNLADVNATQNVNYAALEALITSLSNLTAQEVWEYFNRTANCSNCGSSTLTAADVWTYISRTLTDYNLTEVISYLGNINNTQVLILGNQSLILGNESIIITNIADLNGNMSANFTYIEGRLTLVLGNQTFILGNETLILTNLATLEGNMSGNFTYTNSLINNLNCSGGNGTGSTVYYLNQTVLADSNVSGMQQWLNFQLLLLLVAIAFTALGIWRHNNVFLSAAGIIFVILGISIISDGINAGVGSIAQQSNYTYNGFAQLTNISASDTYAYSAWKDLASSLAGMILILFGLFLFGYSALYVPMKQRRGE